MPDQERDGELESIEGLTSDEVMQVEMAMDRAIARTWLEVLLSFDSNSDLAYMRFLDMLPAKIKRNRYLRPKVTAVIERRLVARLVGLLEKLTHK
jgi:hypothetical protein